MAHEVDTGDLSRADAWSKTLANLQIEGEILAKLPTWHWSTGTLRGFASALLLPITLFLIQRFLGDALAARPAEPPAAPAGARRRRVGRRT